MSSDVLIKFYCVLDSNAHRFEVGRRYTYDYDVTTSTELSGVDQGQSTTFNIKTKVDVEAITKCQLSIYFRSTTVSSVNSFTQQDHLSQLSSQISANPTEVVWQDGVVEDVCAHITDPTWVKNVKRGFISAIQNTDVLDLNEQHTVTENDVSGDCKTTYHTEQRNNKIVVHKHKDLSKCENDHTFVESAVLFSGYDALSTRNTLLESSQQCDQTWSLQNVLQSVKCVEKHLFRPFSYRGNGAQTTLSQNIALISTERNIPPQVLHPIELIKTTLAYEKENIVLFSASNFDKLSASLEEACNLMVQTSNYQSFPSAYIAIVKEMKVASREDLQSVWEAIQRGRICQLHSDDIKTVFLNALPMCVTSNCVAMSVELLETNNIVKVDRLKQWLSSYAMIPQPTEKMISLLAPLLSHPQPSNEVYLTLGTMIHRYCKSTSNCLTSATVVNLLQQFQDSFGTNCHTTNELKIKKILLSLRAVGNAGITTTTSIINSCAAEKRNINDIRISAIHAIRRTDCRSDKSAVMSIFADASEDSELRIAAYSALMRCPNVNLISHLFSIMEKEEVNQVGSYVWSHLMEVKKSSDPLKAYLRSLLKGQKFSEKFQKDKRKYSSYYEASLYSETLNVGGEFDGSLVWSTTSFIPRSIHANVTVDLFGSAVNLVEVGGRMEGVEGLIQDFLGEIAKDNKFLSSFLNPENSRPKRSTEKEFKTALEEIKSYYPHIHKNNEASGSAYIRMFGNEIAFYQLNSQDVETQSWIETANIAYKLFTGTDFNFQHQKVLMDSSVIVATGAGIPLSLQVTSATATDVTMSGHLDFTSYFLKSNSPILMDTHLKPRAALDVSASMAVHLSSLLKTGVELDLKLSTGFDLNGHVSIEQGSQMEIRFDVPEDDIELFNYRSKFFTTNGFTKQELIAPTGDKTFCTENSAERFGMKICTSSSFHSVPMSSTDSTPFLMAAAPQHIQVAIHKTDPGITHYLARGTYQFRFEEDNVLPNTAAVELFVGTPGSYIDRNFTASIMFEKSEMEANLLASALGRSLHVHGSVKNEENLKEGLLQVILDEENVYSVKGHISKTKSNLNKETWSQFVQIQTPYLSPKMQGNLSFVPNKNMDFSFVVSDVLREEVKLKANVVKIGGNKRHLRYNGEMSAYVPGYIDITADLRSHSHGYRDSTKGTLAYGILGKTKQIAVFQHMYREYPVNHGTERWTTSTDFSSSQFPSLNNKIEAQYYKKPTSTESSFSVDYGQHYDYKSNQNKLVMRHYYRNFTTASKTHYDSGITVEAPSQMINYEVNMKHIYEWNDAKNIETTFLLKKLNEKSIFVKLTAQDNSESFANAYGDLQVETPWGEIYSKHQIYQSDATTYTYLSTSGMGKLSELQMQMKAELSTKENNKYVLIHTYLPEASTSNPETDEMTVQELSPTATIALFNASLSKVVTNDQNYKTIAQLEMISPWTERTTASVESHKRTEINRQDIITTISCSCSFHHPQKSIKVSNDISELEQLLPDGSNKMSNAFAFRTDYFSPMFKQRHFTLQGEGNRLTSLNDVRFETRLRMNHNDSQIQSLIPYEADASFIANVGSSMAPNTEKFVQNIGMNAEVNIPHVLKHPISSKIASKFDFASFYDIGYDLSVEFQPALNSVEAVQFKSYNTRNNLGGLNHATYFKVNEDEVIGLNFAATKPSLAFNNIKASWLYDFTQLGIDAHSNVTITAKQMVNEDEITAEFSVTDSDIETPSHVSASMEFSRLRKKLDIMFSHDSQSLTSFSVPPVIDLSARFSSNDNSHRLSLEVTNGEIDLLSTSTSFTMLSPLNMNGEINIRHGFDLLQQFGIYSPLVLKMDSKFDIDALTEINVQTNIGQRSLVLTGILDMSAKFDLQLKKLMYASSQIYDQTIIDLKLGDAPRPVYFKLDDGHKFLESFVDFNIANNQNYANLILQHNYDTLKEICGLPNNMKVGVTCASSSSSRTGKKIELRGDFDEKIMHLLLSNKATSDGYEAEISGTHNFDVLEYLMKIPYRFNHTANFKLNQDEAIVKLLRVISFHEEHPVVQHATLQLNRQDQARWLFIYIAEGLTGQHSIFKTTLKESVGFERQQLSLDVSHSIETLRFIPNNLELHFDSEMNVANGFSGNFTRVINDETSISKIYLQFPTNGDTFKLTSGLKIEDIATYGIIATFQNAESKVLAVEFSSMGETADAKFTSHPLEVSATWNHNFVSEYDASAFLHYPNKVIAKLPTQSKATLNIAPENELSYDATLQIEKEQHRLITTKINFMPIITRKSTTLSVIANYEHNIEELTQLLGLPPTAEIEFEYEINNGQLDTKFWSVDDPFPLLKYSAKISLESNVLLHHALKLYLGRTSTLTVDFNANKFIVEAANKELQVLTFTWFDPEESNFIKLELMQEDTDGMSSLILTQNFMTDYDKMSLKCFRDKSLTWPAMDQTFEFSVADNTPITFGITQSLTADHYEAQLKSNALSDLVNYDLNSIKFTLNRVISSDLNNIECHLQMNGAEYENFFKISSTLSEIIKKIVISHNIPELMLPQETTWKSIIKISEEEEYGHELCVEYECIKLTYKKIKPKYRNIRHFVTMAIDDNIRPQFIPQNIDFMLNLAYSYNSFFSNSYMYLPDQMYLNVSSDNGQNLSFVANATTCLHLYIKHGYGEYLGIPQKAELVFYNKSDHQSGVESWLTIDDAKIYLRLKDHNGSLQLDFSQNFESLQELANDYVFNVTYNQGVLDIFTVTNGLKKLMIINYSKPGFNEANKRDEWIFDVKHNMWHEGDWFDHSRILFHWTSKWFPFIGGDNSTSGVEIQFGSNLVTWTNAQTLYREKITSTSYYTRYTAVSVKLPEYGNINQQFRSEVTLNQDLNGEYVKWSNALTGNIYHANSLIALDKQPRSFKFDANFQHNVTQVSTFVPLNYSTGIVYAKKLSGVIKLDIHQIINEKTLSYYFNFIPGKRMQFLTGLRHNFEQMEKNMIPKTVSMTLSYRQLREIGLQTTVGERQTRNTIKLKKSSSGVGVYFISTHDYEMIDQVYPREIESSVKFHKFDDTRKILGSWSSSNSRKTQQVTIIYNPSNLMTGSFSIEQNIDLLRSYNVPIQSKFKYLITGLENIEISLSLDNDNITTYFKQNGNSYNLGFNNSFTQESLPGKVNLMLTYKFLEQSKNVSLIYNVDKEQWKASFGTTKKAVTFGDVMIVVSHNNREMLQSAGSYDIQNGLVANYNFSQFFIENSKVPRIMSETFSFQKTTTGIELNNDFGIDSSVFSTSIIYSAENPSQYMFTTKLSNSIEELSFVPEAAQFTHMFRIDSKKESTSVNSKIDLTIQMENVLSIAVEANKNQAKKKQVFDLQITSRHRLEQLAPIPMETASTVRVTLKNNKISVNIKTEHDSNVVFKFNFENNDSIFGSLQFADNNFSFHDRLVHKNSINSREWAVTSQNQNIVVIQVNQDSYMDANINARGLGYFDDVGISTKLTNLQDRLSYSTSFSYGDKNIILNIKQLNLNFKSLDHWNFNTQIEFSHSFENNLMSLIPKDLSCNAKAVFTIEEGQLNFVSSKSLLSSEQIIYKHDIIISSNDLKSSLYSKGTQNLVSSVPLNHLLNVVSVHRINLEDFETSFNVSANFDHSYCINLWSITEFNNRKFLSSTGGRYNLKASFPLLVSNDDYNLFGNEISFELGDLANAKLVIYSAAHNITLTITKDRNGGTANLLFGVSPTQLKNITTTLRMRSETSVMARVDFVQENGFHEHASVDFEKEQYNSRIKFAFEHSFAKFDELNIPRHLLFTIQLQNGIDTIIVSILDQELFFAQNNVAIDENGLTVGIALKQNVFKNAAFKNGSITLKYKDGEEKTVSISSEINELEPITFEAIIHRNNGIQFNTTLNLGVLSTIVVVKEIQFSIDAKKDNSKMMLQADLKVDKESMLDINSTMQFVNEDYMSFKISSDHPINFNVTGSLDKQLPNEFEGHMTVDSNYFNHQKYLKVKMDWRKESVVTRALILATTSSNEDDNFMFSFDVLDLKKQNDEDYEFNLIAKKISSHLDTEVRYKFVNSDLHKQFAVEIKHTMCGKDIITWKIARLSTPQQSSVMFTTPLTNELNINMTHSRTIKKVNIKLGDVALMSGGMQITDTDEEASLAVEYKITNEMNGIKFGGNALLSNKNEELLCHVTIIDNFGLDSTLLLTSLSTKEEVLVLQYKTDEDLPTLLPQKMKETDQLIASYLTDVIQNTKSFIEKCSNVGIDVTYLDNVDENMRSILTRSSKTMMQMLTIPSDAYTAMENMKLFVDKILQKLQLPIEDLRALYYDTILVKLKEDVNLAIAKYTMRNSESKLWWEVSHILSDIINHKIDQSEDYVYNIVKMNAPISVGFIEILDNTIYIEIPLFSAATNSEASTLTEKFKTMFGELPLAEYINKVLNVKESQFYYELMSYLRQDVGFLNFHGFASIINGQVVTTFDGAVQKLQGSGCTHLLAHDMKNDRFSLLMERNTRSEVSYAFRTTSEDDEVTNIKISHELKVTINGSNIDLPQKVNEVVILRRVNAVLITNQKANIKLYCEVESTEDMICYLKLDSRYHGSISGILGTMDGEKYNDHTHANGTIVRESVVRDISSWTIEGIEDVCTTLSTQVISQQTEDCVCDKLFASHTSDLRSCFDIVDAKPYMNICKLNQCNAKMACNLASSYRHRCDMRGVETSEPVQCTQCDEIEIVTERTNVEQEHNVVLVSKVGCSQKIYITALKVLANYTNKALSVANVKFGLVQYGDKYKVIRTFNGELFGGLDDLRRIIEDMEGIVFDDNDSTKMDAIYSAVLYPFTPYAKRTVVFVDCDDNCMDSSQIETDEIVSTMSKLEINFHILGYSRLSVLKNGQKYRGMVIGYTSDEVYTTKAVRRNKQSESAKKFQIETSKNSCSRLIDLTSGFYWNLFAVNSRNKAVSTAAVDIIGNRINGDEYDRSQYEAMTMCRQCSCVALHNTFRNVCTPC